VPDRAAQPRECADRARAYAVAQPLQLALDPPVPPPRVVVCQPTYQAADFVVDRRSACFARVGPESSEQSPVPGQQCCWGDEPVAVGSSRAMADRIAPVGPGEPGPAVQLPPEHPHLMAYGEDLGEHRAVAADQQAESTDEPDHHQVQQSNQHTDDRYRGPGNPSSPCVRQVSGTVQPAPTRWPSRCSSPWILRCPHRELSCARRRIRSRISLLTGGLPVLRG
jgi:hypothetical protein